MLASRSAFIVVGLLFSAGLGFYVGQSPIPQLQQEMELINQNNTDLQNTLFQIEEENREFKNELQNILDNLTLQNQEFKKTINELNETKMLYQNTLEDYNSLLITYNELLSEYNELLSEYYEPSTEPEGEMIVTLITGV
jgi:chromosome segregation ATPase